MKSKQVMRWNVINELLSVTKRRRFLEIGVQRGICAGHVVEASEKWGVDPHPMSGARRHYGALHKTTSDAFFAKLPPTELFDVIMVDGLHHAEQVLRDVENSLKHLAPGGYIVMHDCNPVSEIAQRVPRAVGVWNGDCWKAMVELRKRADLICFTVDSDHGVGVVRRGVNPEPLTGVPEMKALSYTALERNRSTFVGLTPASRWEERLGSPFEIGRVVVVSAIFGARDQAVRLPTLDVDDCILFTDNEKAPDWTVIRQDAPTNPRLHARRLKTLALDYVDADVVVWIDGRITPLGTPIRPMLRRALRTAAVASYPHPWRTCVYEEARECALLGLAPKGDLEAQTEAYAAAGFPRGAGLWNTMVVARRRTDATVELGRNWWAEIEKHSVRDQVSFPYVLWQAGMKCNPLGHDVYAQGSSLQFSRGYHRNGD